MGLEKMEIIPLTSSFTPESPIKVMYNPAEFTIETKNQFQRTSMPGLQAPVTQFISGETQTVSFSLFFDTYEKKTDVRNHTKEVVDLLAIKGDLHAPPICVFRWGGPIKSNKSEFVGVIDSCSQKYTMFLESGVPVRATLTLSVSEYQDLEGQLKTIRFESADRTKIRIYKEGDSLWGLAHKEYGDPAHWRVIALANGVIQPRYIEPGAELRLPPLES